MPVIGTPRSSALCTVQRPVPFCSAWSSTMSTNGLPVTASSCDEHVGGDLDEEGLEVALVPLREDLGELRRGGADNPARSRSYASAISCMSAYSMPLCTIFTKCPAPSGPDVHAARRAVDLRGDRLEDRAELFVGLGRAAGHDRRAVQRALLAAGHAAADEVHALLAQRPLAAAGVGEVRVAAVDDDVAVVEQRHSSSITASVGSPALTMMMIARGFFSEATKSSSDSRGHERALVAVLRDQRVGAGVRAVVQRDRVPVPGQVAGQVASHDRQPGDADVRNGRFAHGFALRISGDSAACSMRSGFVGLCSSLTVTPGRKGVGAGRQD